MLAERLERVYNFYQDKVSFEPKVTMLILNPQDWGKFTTFPVYGMPHYDEKRDFLIVASEDNDFWKSFIPDLSQLPKKQADEKYKLLMFRSFLIYFLYKISLVSTKN